MKCKEVRFNGEQYTAWFQVGEEDENLNDAGICDVLRSFDLPSNTHLDVSDRGWYIRYSFPETVSEETVRAVLGAVKALEPIY